MSSGNLRTFTDAKGQVTEWTYDDRNRPLTRTDALRKTETYAYDTRGNINFHTDRKGQVSGFQYDLLDRRTQAGYGATSTVNPVYQNNSQYTWDPANRLTRIDDSQAGTITRSYDDRFDTLKQESGPEGTVDTTYYANGLKQSVDPTGGPVVTHTYDTANRLTGLSQAAGVGPAEPASVQTVTLAYDSADRRTRLTLANGIQIQYTWDNASQLTALTYKKADNTLIGDLTYTYDAAGQRTGLGGSLAATDLPADVPTTAYDADNRLTNWNGQLLSYDDNGNLQSDGTTTYTWNSRDQLIALAGATSASFAYDGLGRRKSKTVGGVSTAYLYDGMNPIQEQSGASIQANLLAGPGLDQWFARTQGGQTVSYLPDALGSTLALANASQAIATSYTYEPYGKTTTTGAATNNPFAYTGRENDGTGLYYYRARYYHSGLSRFVSEDPIGLDGGPNLYSYVGGNPVSKSDPTGLDPGMGGGTDSCSHYAERCAQSGGTSAYYCRIAPLACNYTPPSDWTRCVRQCLQDFDKACGRCSDGSPDVQCTAEAHAHCWIQCVGK